MKKIVTIIVLGILGIQLYAQANKEGDIVSLIVSADGATKEEATKLALRSAIEQAYGTFVSSNTTILNDELIKDEIATVSSGNIKSYHEMSTTVLPDGRTLVTLEATVCISNLVAYSKSKGAIVEFSGSLFGINHDIREMNKKNEIIVLKNLIKQIQGLLPYAYDKSISFSDVKETQKGKCEFIATVSLTETAVMKDIKKLYWNTLFSIGLKTSEINEYKSSGIEMTPVIFDIDDNTIIKSSKEFSKKRGENRVWLRNSVNELLMLLAELQYTVVKVQTEIDLKDNNGDHSRSIFSPNIIYDPSHLRFLQSSYGKDEGLAIYLKHTFIGLGFTFEHSGYIEKSNCWPINLRLADSSGSYSDIKWFVNANFASINSIKYTLSVPMDKLKTISKFEIDKSSNDSIPLDIDILLLPFRY